MGYRVANIANGRRVGDMSSGPRTVGYDANPRGLAGTNSNIHRLAGTNNTASDYKKNKKKKEDKKKDKDKKKENYPPQEDEIPPQMKPAKAPKASKTYMPEEMPEYEGHGWDLILSLDDENEVVFASSDEPKFGEDDNWFHIINVSDGESIKLPTAPLENGMVKHDHKVEEPITLTITGWVKREYTDKVNKYLKIAKQSKSLKTYFELFSPWKTYSQETKNPLYLKKSKSKVSTDKYDVYEYTLELQELLIATSITDQTNDPNLSSNSAKGAAKGK